MKTAQWRRCALQDMKGVRWMPWRQEPRKDVGGCDNPRGPPRKAKYYLATDSELVP